MSLTNRNTSNPFLPLAYSDEISQRREEEEEDDRNQNVRFSREFHSGDDQVQNILASLNRILSDPEKVLSGLCCALADVTSDQIPSAINAGVCGQLVELLSHESATVYVPALRTFGNIVAGGDNNQAQAIIDLGVLPCLRKFLVDDCDRNIKKEVVWTVSNLLVGTEQQIQRVIAANLIGPVVDLLQHAEFDIQEESAWAISNASFHGAPEQIKYLASQGCIKPLCDLLICPDSDIIMVCLEALENILRVGETEKDVGEMNVYFQMIDSAGGWVLIDDLQKHEMPVIKKKVLEILITYGVDDSDHDSGDASLSCSGFGGSDPVAPS